MTQATLADKVMTAAYYLDTGCPIKDVLTDEEIDLAISMLADVLLVTGTPAFDPEE